MNNHLQLCRILLLQIHGKLKPTSILSPFAEEFEQKLWLLSCPAGSALGVWLVLHTPGNAGASGWVEGRSGAVTLLWEAGSWWRWVLGWDSSAWSSINGSVWDRGCRGFKSPWEGRLQVTCGPWPSGTQICSLRKCRSNKTYWKSHPRMPASLQMSLYRS